MRATLKRLGPVCSVCCLVIVACGGGAAPEAETPEAPAKDTAEASESAAPEEAAEPAPAEEEKAPPPAETPKTILVREGTLFMLDVEKSDMGIKAEETCKKKSGEDVAKQANCVSKALSKMVREGIAFDEDDDGKWWYIRFGVEKGVQVEYNRVQVEVGEPQGRNITLTTTGQDKAKRRKGTVPKELVFEVPDEYTVVLQDPSRGRLEFEPKLGLLGDNAATP